MKTFAPIGLIANAATIRSRVQAASIAPAATFVVIEHPALTRARLVLGTVAGNSPRPRLRAGSFAFSI